MNETPKITLRPRTPEEEARSREEAERKNRLIDNAYERAVGDVMGKIPEALSDADKHAVLYGEFLGRMTYDFEWSENVNEDGTVNRPHDPYGEKYDLIIDGERLHVDHEELAMIRSTGVCEHFAKAFADIANRLGTPCSTVTGRTKVVRSINGNNVKLGHMWNQVLIGNEVMNVDVTYGLFAGNEEVKAERGIVPELTAGNFFIIDSEELRRIGPHHDFEDAPELLAKR